MARVREVKREARAAERSGHAARARRDFAVAVRELQRAADLHGEAARIYAYRADLSMKISIASGLLALILLVIGVCF